MRKGKSKFGSVSYALTEREQDYLMTGETGGYKRGQLAQQIRQKAERFDTRLMHLRLDAELLLEAGYIEEEDVPELLEVGQDE